MQTVVLAVASTLGALCGGVTLVLLLYALCHTRLRRRDQRLAEKAYCSLQQPYEDDTLSQEKMQILQPAPSLETVPFQVPGPFSSRGWGPDTPKSSCSDLDLLSRASEMDEVEHPRFLRVIKAKEASCLGYLDPAIYKMVDEEEDYDIPDHHIGRIWFAVAYEIETEKLLVTLIKARNLPSRSFGAANVCDPLARIYLLPDERRYMQSKPKKKTCNPKFNEDFIFQVAQRTFSSRVLKLTVFDIDRHKRHRVIGHTTYPLQEHNEQIGDKAVMWRDLERDIPDTTLERGDVMVSLCYNNHYERLTVGVFEGRNFKKMDEKHQADFYLRVSVLLQSRVSKTKKTSTIRHTNDPVFNESFNFKLAQSQLDSASVSVNAVQVMSGTRDKCTGRIVIGSFMFARSKELEHWNEMVANQRQQISHWHALT